MNIDTLRNTVFKIAIMGSYPVVQSILDYDYMVGKEIPSVKFIVSNSKSVEKLFFGKKEIKLKVYESIEDVPFELKKEINAVIVLNSARRVLQNIKQCLNNFPNLNLLNVFAEDLTEKDSLEAFNLVKDTNVKIIGPSSVGLLIPNVIKFGTISGVDFTQLNESNILKSGNVAVFSASGGMTNELIRICTGNGKNISFALSFGGDRFPIFRPLEAFLMAEKDPNTEVIVYYGELGGFDEYEVAKNIKKGNITKKIIAYIAGSISDAFEKPVQFGHAKAMANLGEEKASSKRQALKTMGVIAPDSFSEFVLEIKNINSKVFVEKNFDILDFTNRKNTIISTSIYKEVSDEVYLMGEKLEDLAESKEYLGLVLSMFLGHKPKSNVTINFFESVCKLLIDHGPMVSGALNTIISARAGKDLVSSVSSGLLTVGPRFGGAINISALNWLEAVKKNINPLDFVEQKAKNGEYILGIGHKKYRRDLPDPRVEYLLKFLDNLKISEFTKFAKSVESITTTKKANLILNVDGVVASLMLDILFECEGYDIKMLEKLVDIEFFNALFVFTRTAGFISHFLDQKRNDEGLFRLDKDLVLME